MSRCPFLRFDPLAFLGGVIALLAALVLPALMFGAGGVICALMLIGVLVWVENKRPRRQR